MANYSILKAAIAQVIKTNGNNEITGNLLQQQLFSMVNTLGTGYQCMGVAVLTPTPTNPGTPDANVFYIASEPGTYANFGNIVINDGEVCLLTYNGTWSKRVTGAATASQLNQLGQNVNNISKGFVYYNDSELLNIDTTNQTIGINASGTKGFVTWGSGQYQPVSGGLSNYTTPAFGLYFVYVDRTNRAIKMIIYSDYASVDWDDSIIIGQMTFNADGTIVWDGIPFAHKVNGKIVKPNGVNDLPAVAGMTYLTDDLGDVINIDLVNSKVIIPQAGSSPGYFVTNDGVVHYISRGETTFNPASGTSIYYLVIDGADSSKVKLLRYTEISQYDISQTFILGCLSLLNGNTVAYDGLLFEHKINGVLVNNRNLNSPQRVFKGLTYMSDTAYINIDLINKKIVTGGLSSTPGYIAVGNGEWKKIGLGETEFVVNENSTGIYFLFLNGNNNNLVTLVDYTRVGNYDWRNCVVLGIIAISTYNNPPTIVGDNLTFAHQVNGAWVNKAQKNALQGKKISIFGDSISTYAGYIPSENATFFPRTGYDVNDVNFTWWKRLLDATGMILEINNSWSGSRIATPPAGRTEKAFTNPDRYNNLGNPDIIIVFGGINDEFAQSDPTTPGEFNLSTAGNMDVTQFKQAYQFLVRALQTNYPNAKLFICTPTFKGASGIFENNGVGINQYEFHNVIRQIADMYGCGFIDLAKCGINVYNYQTYLDDTVHPNRKGMQLIFEKVMGTLNAYYNGSTGVNV